MKRINLWTDDVNKLKGLEVGDEFFLQRTFNFSGCNGFNAKKHLERNMPIGKKLWVAENISHYRKNERVYWSDKSGIAKTLIVGGRTQTGYTADANIYSLDGWSHDSVSYPPSKMPKDFSRFKIQVIGYEKIFNDSTSWFSTYVRYKLIEKIV